MIQPSTMLAAVFNRCGDAANVIEIRQLPVPQPTAGEVLLSVQAASMHPADRMFIAGAYRGRPVFPQRAGFVGAGVVVRCGEGVDVPVGTSVAFRHPGAWAEYCAVPVGKLFTVPPGIGLPDACQFALNPVTAWALLDVASVQRGDWLAVNAPRSNVAQMVRGLARERGIHVADMPEHAGQAGDSLARALLSASGNAPIAAVLDAVGGPRLAQVLPALRQGAVLVSYGLLADAPVSVHSADLIFRNLSWQGFGIDHWLAGHPHRRDAMLSELWTAVATRRLVLPVREQLPLAALHEALQADAAAGAGKVILTMGAEE